MEMKTITVTIPAKRTKSNFARRIMLYKISRILWTMSVVSFLIGVSAMVAPVLTPQTATLLLCSSTACLLASRIRPRRKSGKR